MEKMRGIQKLSLSVVSLAVVGSGIMGLPAYAAAGTYTWKGDAGDGKLATAANWAENAVPADGAKLVFPCIPGSGSVELINDLSAKIKEISTVKQISNAPITPASSCKSYAIDKVDFQADVKFSGEDVSAGDTPFVSIGSQTGIKNLSVDNSNVEFSHAVTKIHLDNFAIVNQGCNEIQYVVSSKNTTIGESAGVSPKEKGNITVKRGGTLGALSYESISYENNVTFEAGSKVGWPKACKGGAGTLTDVTVTLTGDIVLNGDVEYKIGSTETVKITGKLSGSGKFVPSAQNEGKLVVESRDNTSGTPNGEQGAKFEPETIHLDDESNDALQVKRNQTVFLNGKRGWISVNEGGVLKGNATVDSLYVSGVVAPGNSPGKITVLTNGFALNQTGTYEAELFNKDQYDQIVVQAGGVNLEGTLKLMYLPGGKISKNETFVIIDNKGSGPVNGTFKNLPEGAEVTVDGAVFTISYRGGDGNDVVLTAQNDSVGPKAPNTGVKEVLANPAIVAGTGVVALGALFISSKKR
ncbi:MAG: hypothetical protein D8G53_07190 [Candidatus Saccharimonas sp.]|nr:MAG: hypothetical protein D8G53_07190 [Candidatus Saccharimonas sp.]